MGGFGSGKKGGWWGEKKAVVEDCLSLDANRWTRQGILKAGVVRAGSWRWTYSSGGSFSVSYDVNTLEPVAPSVRLSYWWVWSGCKERQSAEYAVRLTTTRPRFGGLRWWFVCPLTVDGVACTRRVGKLYLPPGARYYGCRRCHRLTYRSSQEHDRRVDALRRDPGALRALLQNLETASVGQLSLALKASRG